MSGRGESKLAAGDLLLPLAVVGVVGMMVFPLPTPLLDLLLVLNIGFSLALIVSSVYLAEPESFTALPSILLLATLFRLGLNISTTRQLLASGCAPHLVVAFGQFVVGGNLVVGIVIFLIVTVVQFLVIAKGAERVAEVAARFTLDAMPGKQMSIDADVRSGIISIAEARERRRELHRESKLYGALDGAMKFVKGDAIAGLLITLINIGAGLFLGITEQGLSFAAALHKYTIFTIGDGLVSQIPALLVCVAAGIVVTRVGDKEDSLIGRDILSQLGNEPQALGATGTVLFLMGFLPGMPAPAFILIGVLVIALARARKAAGADEQASSVEEFRPNVGSPVVLRLTAAALVQIKKEQILSGLIRDLRSEIFESRGVLLPEFSYQLDRRTEAAAAALHLNGVRSLELKLNTDAASGLLFSRMLVEHIKSLFDKRIVELVNDTQTRILLEVHQPAAEDLINALVPALIPVTKLTAVLRELLSERVSIRQLPLILQAAADYLSDESSPAPKRAANSALVSQIRLALARTISAAAADERGVVVAATVNLQADLFMSRLAVNGMPFPPDLCSAIYSEIKGTFTAERPKPWVIICSAILRPLLSRYLRREFDHLLVIAGEEISDDVSVEQFGELFRDLAAAGGYLRNSLFKELEENGEGPGAELGLPRLRLAGAA